MELVPKEELESYMQGVPKSVADQRARKVSFFLLECYEWFLYKENAN